MPRNLARTHEQQQLERLDPYMGDYSALAEQFLKGRRYPPIHSVGQGIAEAGGDIISALLMRKAAEKEQAKQDKDFSDLAMAQQIVADPSLTSHRARALATNSPVSIQGSVFSGPADANERYSAGMTALRDNPRAAVGASPGILDMAKQFEPPPRLVDERMPGGGLGQRDPRTGKLDVKIQPDWAQTPGGFDARRDLAKAGAAQTNVNMPPAERSYQTKRGGDFADAAKSYQEGGRAAGKKLGQLQVLESALSDPALYQGTGGNAIAGLKRAGKTLLNLDIDGVGAAEVVSKIGAETALGLKNNLPGPMSDADRKFLLDLPPGLSNSREGNIRLIDYQRRLARREMEVAELARNYEKEVGQLDVGFDALLADYAEQNPLFTEDDLKEVAQVARMTPQPLPTAGMDRLFQEADAIAAGALGR